MSRPDTAAPLNTVLQRTRSALLRSPLSRKPFGRSSAKFLAALTLVALRCSSQPAPSSSQGRGPNVESLSGDWQGTFEVRRVGGCTVGKSDSTSDRFRGPLSVQADGAFELRTYDQGGSEKER